MGRYNRMDTEYSGQMKWHVQYTLLIAAMILEIIVKAGYIIKEKDGLDCALIMASLLTLWCGMNAVNRMYTQLSGIGYVNDEIHITFRKFAVLYSAGSVILDLPSGLFGPLWWLAAAAGGVMIIVGLIILEKFREYIKEAGETVGVTAKISTLLLLILMFIFSIRDGLVFGLIIQYRRLIKAYNTRQRGIQL